MPQFIANDPAALADYVKSLEHGLVVFDGRPGAGKTFLACEMTRRLHVGAVDADPFLVPDQRKFVDALKLPQLRQCIQASFAATPLVVLSTLCGRQVAEKLNLEARTVFVWIEPTTALQLEVDQQEFAGDRNADPPSAGHKEIEAYIAAFKARTCSDVVYFNVREAPMGYEDLYRV
jgi:hypothetical protein